MEFGLIIHGGAWDIPDKEVEDHVKGIQQALQIGYSRLNNGNSALDTVEQVITQLENDPTFDAGTGSFLNAVGNVEMDAIIATDDYRIGAIGALQNFKNPIQVARALLEKDGPVMLVGNGASKFASQHGFKECKPTDLLTGRELERYRKIQQDPKFIPKNAFSKKSHGTVGAVALDKKGNQAVAVSTGGTPKKAPGRLGDSPLFGSGVYIEPQSIGVAATGYGEDLIKVLISRRVFEFYRSCNSLQKAVEKAIQYLSRQVNGYGGVIALGEQEIGLAWNTPRMAFGVQIKGEIPITGIEKEDRKKLSDLRSG